MPRQPYAREPLMNYISAHPDANRAAIAAALGRQPSAVTKMLVRLHLLGLVECDGNGKSATWRIAREIEFAPGQFAGAAQFAGMSSIFEGYR